jgi:hypothetical protein|eukprot:COSAG06_NODE_4847_length_3908_cov_2.577579_3_plen_71_part_00
MLIDVCGAVAVRAFNLVVQVFLQPHQLAKLEALGSVAEESGSESGIDAVWGRFLVFTEGYLQCGAGRTEG